MHEYGDPVMLILLWQHSILFGDLKKSSTFLVSFDFTNTTGLVARYKQWSRPSLCIQVAQLHSTFRFHLEESLLRLRNLNVRVVASIDKIFCWESLKMSPQSIQPQELILSVTVHIITTLTNNFGPRVFFTLALSRAHYVQMRSPGHWR